jgi:hypothetical protein
MPQILASGLELTRQLSRLPANTRGAFVVIADSTSVRMGVMHKFSDHWQMSAELEQQWAKKRPDFKVTIAGSW